MNICETPQGRFDLQRYPEIKNQPLQAWDAADLYILRHLDEAGCLSSDNRLLIMNDSFGALTTALAETKPQVMGDSYLAHKAIQQNLLNNRIDTEKITQLTSLDHLQGQYDTVLIKVPKTLALLEDQLYRLRTVCSEKTLIVAAGMTKHIHTSTLKLFETIIGPTQTSLAWKKARLILAQREPNLTVGTSPYPDRYRLSQTDAAVEGEYINHANVFSRQKLDIGSRFLLPCIPSSDRYQRIVDLACGNGVLGIRAAELNPQATVLFTDESYMAIESAKQNAMHLLDDSERCEFLVTDGMQGIEENSVDLIVNNPPFHQQNVVGDYIAWSMFRQAYRCLRKGGELYVVGNRHMAYHAKLKKLFGSFDNLSASKKFVVLRATKN